MGSETKLGMNRTGKDTAPLLSKEMLEGTEELTVALYPEGDDQAIAENRIRYMRESDPVGSVPVPASVKGVLKSGVQMLKGKDPTLLFDKLGERLAFERTGVRLYEALISKFRADSSALSHIVTLERLDEIREEELKHFHKLSDVMLKLGADPTAVTPAADVTAVASTGIIQVLGDPRINFIQSLDAILVAELSDNDSWDLLIQLTDQQGFEEINAEFKQAYQEEQEHLETIRSWIQQFRLGKVQAEKKTA